MPPFLKKVASLEVLKKSFTKNFFLLKFYRNKALLIKADTMGIKHLYQFAFKNRVIARPFPVMHKRLAFLGQVKLAR